jgi:hypothetical protein
MLRVFLCPRSPVLRAMLTAPMREQITGRIVLPNITLDTGLGLISFLYNGQMEPGSDYEGLLELAEKYDIKVLATGAFVTLTKIGASENLRENICTMLRK